jgi:hypothetical protein
MVLFPVQRNEAWVALKGLNQWGDDEKKKFYHCEASVVTFSEDNWNSNVSNVEIAYFLCP